jgi:hypothetical protein
MMIRRRTRFTTAALCAVMLGLVAACSSQENPAPSTTPMTSSSSPTPSPSPSSSSPSPLPTSSAASVVADAATIAWFRSFCTEFAGLALMDPTDPVGATGETPQQKQAKKVAGYESATAALNSAATKLSAAPAPGIPNGAALATAVIGGLKELGKAVGDAGAQLKSATVTSEESFLAAETAAREQLELVDETIEAKVVDAITPAKPYLQGIPECAPLAA